MSSPPNSCHSTIFLMLFTTVFLMLFGLPGAIHVSIQSQAHSELTMGAELHSMMSVDEEMTTLKNLQSIALQYKTTGAALGSRHSTTGFNQSLDLITTQLQSYGLEPWLQKFTSLNWARGDYTSLTQFVELLPQELILGTDFDVMSFSRKGIVTAGIAAPSSVSTGCDISDWNDGVQGKIAIVSRGICTFKDKAIAAARAGAKGLLIYDSSTPGLIAGTLGSDSDASIPVFVIRASLADSFLANPFIILKLSSDAYVFDAKSANLIVDLPGGRPENQIVVGAHIDSVVGGPGINDDGSGSAMVLELARVFMGKYGSDRDNIHNQVRLMWFGEEESGKVGSNYYVQHMSETELHNTAAMLNFDMIGSKNFVNGILTGAEDDKNAVQNSYLTRLFATYFESIQQYPHVLTPMTGRSDYASFEQAGIPTSGLTTGSGTIKTKEQAEIFGGTADQPCDQCYHKVCDNIDNVNQFIYDKTSRAAAYAMESLATEPNLRATMANPSVANFIGQKSAAWFLEEADVEIM